METLIADDDRLILRMLEMLFRSSGLKVRCAANGLEAVETFRRYHQRIGLVLIDFHMPGLSGAETIAEIRKIDPDIPVLLMTGDHEVDNFVKNCEAVSKPFKSLPALIEKVKRTMSMGAVPNK
jgi:DNA-binding NtrC family response regulator